MTAQALTDEMQPHSRITVESFMLCDYARVEHGKMYIVGGGWSRLYPTELPFDLNAYISIKLRFEENVPASEAIQLQIGIFSAEHEEFPGEHFMVPVDRSSFNDDTTNSSVLVCLGLGVRLFTSGRYVAYLFTENSTIAKTYFTVADPGSADPIS